MLISNKLPSSFVEYISSDISPSDLNNNQTGGKTSKKWTDLKHNGVIFYPEYEPHGVLMLYGQLKIPIRLNPEAEEFATYYVNSRFDKYRTDRFNKNFFADWKKLLSPELKKTIVDFALCDFDQIKQYVLKTSEQKKIDNKNLSKIDKDEKKTKTDVEKEMYRFATVDGKQQVIDNFLVEPPTIFVGRGDHPLSGKIKNRLYPENITINVGKDMPIPVPKFNKEIRNTDGSGTARDRWGAIICDNTLEWIASWQNNVTQKYNYARFGRMSGFKMKSDELKYNKARILKKKIKKIRIKNEINMKSSDPITRQHATALYLIDHLALRIGNEKKEDEADTVGVSTLKIKNIHILENNMIKLDFLGKDSVRYVNKFKVIELVYNNIKEFRNSKDKSNQDALFDLINSDSLNRYIKQFMKHLSSKVFRTYNASYLMQIELKKITSKYKDYDKPDKLLKLQHEYDMANLKVAKLCNHQKEVSKGSGSQIEKTHGKLADMQTKLRKLKKDKEKKIASGAKTTTTNKKIAALQDRIKMMKSKKSFQTESKNLSSGTSKINYIDPRITISFLKANKIIDGIDKFFSKTQQRQFEWALTVDESYNF
jgi:DNA topoisomerase-1